MDGNAGHELLPGEVACMTGYSTQMIRWLVDHGRLQARRGPGGVRLIPRAAAERLAHDRAALEQHARDPKAVRDGGEPQAIQDRRNTNRYRPACASVRPRW